MAIAVVVGFLAVFLLLAWRGLSGLGGDPFARPRSATPGASATSATSTPPAAASPTSSPASPTSSPTSVPVRRAAAFDPDGDGSENDGEADLAVDGDPDTAWTSDTYRSARFGGLKPGLGLRLRLDGQRDVHRVQVRVGGSGSTVQLRRVDGDTVSSTVLDRQRDASGTVTLRPSAPVRADEIVVWFTRAARSDGGYRVEVAEVSVS
jgi:putative peptidoglycan lipid II flippase